MTDCTNCDWLPMIRLGHTKTFPPTKTQSERHERAQRRKEEQLVKEQIIRKTAEVISEEDLHLTVKEQVMVILKEAMKEFQLVENSTVMVMEKYILEFIKSDLAEVLKEEMEAEYVRFAEAERNYAAAISSL